MEFEAAAQQHAKIAKVKSVLSACDEISGRLDQLDAFIIQPSAEKSCVTLFRFREGTFTSPLQLTVEGEGESLDARLRTAVEQLPKAGAHSASHFSEELAILKRWYYRSHKTGEIVFAKAEKDLPVRKLANAVMRVHRGEKAPMAAPAHEPQSSATSGQSQPAENN